MTPTTRISVTIIVNRMSRERGANRARPILPRRQVHARRQLRFERRQQVPDGVGHLDGVAARLPHHLQRDRPLDVGFPVRILLIEPVAVEHVLDAVDDVRDVAEPHRRTVSVGHDDRPERVGVHQLTGGLDRVRRVRAVQLAGRLVDVPVGDRLIDLVDPDLLRVQLFRIDLHANRVLRRALHLDLRHAAHHRNARRDQVLRELVERRHRQRLRVQVQHQDRLIGGVVLAERRRRRHGRRQERHDCRNRGLDVGRRAVDVASQIELQRDVRAARIARRGDGIDARRWS